MADDDSVPDSTESSSSAKHDESAKKRKRNRPSGSTPMVGAFDQLNDIIRPSMATEQLREQMIQPHKRMLDELRERMVQPYKPVFEQLREQMALAYKPPTAFEQLREQMALAYKPPTAFEQLREQMVQPYKPVFEQLREQMTVAFPETSFWKSDFARIAVGPSPQLFEDLTRITDEIAGHTVMPDVASRITDTLARNQADLARVNGFTLRDSPLQLPTDDSWDEIAERVQEMNLPDAEIEEAVDELIEEIEALFGESPALAETQIRLRTKYGTRTCRLMLATWFGGMWTYAFFLLVLQSRLGQLSSGTVVALSGSVLMAAAPVGACEDVAGVG